MKKNCIDLQALRDWIENENTQRNFDKDTQQFCEVLDVTVRRFELDKEFFDSGYYELMTDVDDPTLIIAYDGFIYEICSIFYEDKI